MRYPDVLVFDRDYNFKFALDGSPTNTAARRGYLYPWKRSQIREMDTAKGRLRLAVALEPDDKVFGFYFYQERDIIYRGLDINPFTNPVLKNRVIEFVYDDEETPFRRIFHRVFSSPGMYDLALSDTNIASGTVIGNLTVGGSVSLNEFSTTDSRTRGGGLAEQFHDIPESEDNKILYFVVVPPQRDKTTRKRSFRVVSRVVRTPAQPP